MDNSNVSKHRPNEYLGVNKIGKNIRKSPLHQPNFVNSSNGGGVGVGGNGIGSSPARQPPQPQVYNISKNDFRSIVQQLTGSPSRNDPLPRPPVNHPPKNSSMRLQRIRPPPLTPINRPQMQPVVVAQAPMQPQPQGLNMGPSQVQFNNGFNNGFARPPPQFGQRSPRGMQPPPQYGQPSPRGMPPPQFGQPSPRGMQQFAPGNAAWTTPALSPISAYMQQLQNCIGDEGSMPGHQQWQPQMSGQFQAQHQMQLQVPGQYQGMRAQPPMQPQGLGQAQGQPPVHPQVPGQVHAQSPSSGLLPNPNVQPLPSPGTNGTGLLPSPTSQFLLPSPSFVLPSPSFFNCLSPTPRSPYPLLSPGSQFPPPLSPNFAFSQMGQNGILGSGPGPQPPPSPGYGFPLSPSGFFPLSSPGWRDQ